MNDGHEPLTESVRSLIDAVIRTEVDPEKIAAAHAHVAAALDILGEQMMPGAYGVRAAPDGRRAPRGNVLIGERNAIAPPLIVDRDEAGLVSTEVDLGAAYEGPVGHVHGGVCSLILDHLLGATAHRPDRPAFTGTLQLRYVRPTPLGPLRAEAWVEHEDGRKTYARGRILSAGQTTVEAQGVFIRPRADRSAD
ncbi:PaaI family thioesterase [Mycolicibacterium monacense]|uniref:Acyl-coenzyme A thioesterase THEM4 n=4 Tax=Mycobacteriaceae TaxID=1762 RepID=A0AAD1J0R8_MYCMB|nr:PaaI family thioesterase [Mycolicibacterium monacense]MDA4104302.1 thioesterase [Mycolicibacterium monacense DSM 44395]ORB24623.1 thioesterase [Mycolicibacterium monacense DSM 44395]QHP84150.1 PaaI family thioesterase [Mycolicibacterium monacense DSM 44395]BBZ63125.1 thioesterase [Mycolicibacterium monacense]